MFLVERESSLPLREERAGEAWQCVDVGELWTSKPFGRK
jgi:hypothetical protein